MSQSTISVELMTTETFNMGEGAVGVADLFEGTNPPVEFLYAIIVAIAPPSEWPVTMTFRGVPASFASLTIFLTLLTRP